jgi:carboxylate-amine ligase
MQGVRPPGGLWIGVAGLDIVRGGDGGFQVLEDNVRTPSGFAYAAAARRALAAHLEIPPGDAPRTLDDLPAMLMESLRAASPGGSEPRVVLLTDGVDNPAYYEHEWAAKQLGVPLLEPGALDLDAVDVIYRRTNADRLDTEVGQMLLEPLRSGRIGVVNAFGTGVADDKLAHAYVEDMIRFYAHEEPLLPSVETFDLGAPGMLERALDVFDELVVKPRGGYGGEGVWVLPHADPGDREAARRAVRERPEDYVAQRMVMISSHPTVVGGRLVPRHVDLRPYVFLARDGEVRTLPGGLTRVAFDEGSLVVNSSQNGGAKDTWVLP